MRQRILLWALIVTLLLVTSEFSLAAQAPLPPLPVDLLFVTNSAPGRDYPRTTIMRVDAETLETTPFYVDPEADEILPISWSPQGNLLAIYRIMPAIDEALTLFPRQLCILDRAGVLQRCLDDSPPMHYGGFPEQNWTSYYPVAWEPDGQTIYFDTEYINEDSLYGYGRRLVEASVITGETLRIVYDYPDPYPVTFSPDLNHLSVGLGGPWYFDNPAYVFDLQTGTELDIPDLTPDQTVLYWTGWAFSPSGQFVSAVAHYNLMSYAPDLVAPDDYREGQGSLLLILDMQGIVQHIVAEPTGSPAAIWNMECPFWQPDEQAIVFIAWDATNRYVMRYSLADHQMTPIYEAHIFPNQELYLTSPLIPSPDGNHIALTVANVPYGDRQLAVLYPDGEIRRIPNDFRLSLYPLWLPRIPD